MARPRFLPDNMTLCLIAVVIAASLFPVHGQAAVAFDGLTNAAIALLFFMHGAKLSREAIIAGMTHWRLHLLVFACTFIMFPLLGVLLKPALVPLVGDELYLGILFLCALPATVQSAIAFTSIARGNVAAAVCSAATSSLLGIFVTPLLVLLLMGAQAGESNTLDAIGKIVVQLLLPFIAGQIARRWIGDWVCTQQGLAQERGSGLDSACGFRRVQPCGGRGYLANRAAYGAAGAGGCLLSVAGAGTGPDRLAGSPSGL